MKKLSLLFFMKRIRFLKSEVKIVEKYLQGAFRKTYFYRNSCFLRISSVTVCFLTERYIQEILKSLTKRRNKKIFT